MGLFKLPAVLSVSVLAMMFCLSRSEEYSYEGDIYVIDIPEFEVQLDPALYGPPTTSTTTLRYTNTNPSSIRPVTTDELCADHHVKIDAIITAGQGQTYVFIGALYWRLEKYSVVKGYPKKIKDFWDGLPNDIDAAIAWDRSVIYFFKDDKFWRMTNFVMDSGYPKLIKEGFPGIPDKIDAAFRWSANGALYFFRGSQYWRYDVDQTVPVSNDYPQPIINWGGVPSDLDAALTHSNGKTYFFKDGSYFRFNDLKFAVDVSTPSYPRPVGPSWLGCAN